MSAYKERVVDFTAKPKEDVVALLPAIKNGSKDATALSPIIQRYDESEFNLEKFFFFDFANTSLAWFIDCKVPTIILINFSSPSCFIFVILHKNENIVEQLENNVTFA